MEASTVVCGPHVGHDATEKSDETQLFNCVWLHGVTSVFTRTAIAVCSLHRGPRLFHPNLTDALRVIRIYTPRWWCLP